MKKLLRKLFNFIPIFFVVIVLNLTIDPANIFNTDYESEAASIIVSGKNVVGMTNYDERTFQKEVMRKEEHCPNTIIAGSSRVMELSDESIEGLQNYRNMGMSGAGLYDIEGVTGLYLDRYQQLPSEVIIGLDPWMLNDNNGDERYRKLSKYIDLVDKKMTTRESRKSGALLEKTDLLQVISLSYFHESFNAFIKDPVLIFKTREIDYYGTNERDSESGIRYSDGSTDYPAQYKNRTIEEINESAREYATRDVYQLEDFYGMSDSLSDRLSAYVDYLNQNGTKIEFFLPPYHPVAYELLINNDKYCIIVDVEEYFRNLAKKKNIPIYGSYNPSRLDCVAEDFLDGMHVRRDRIYKAWRLID